MIYDKNLISRWIRIKRHLTTTPEVYESYGVVAITKNSQTIYIAKNTTKMRLKSHLDWAYYTPKTLAYAIDNDLIDSYYEVMLKNVNSDPNIWNDKDLEMELKTYYAIRDQRAEPI
jgi:hypothetical protein